MPYPKNDRVPVVPDHELLRLIARGSYGEVWLARNTLGTYRAIKVVYQDTFRDQRPFERELSGVQKFEPVSRLHEGLMDVLQVGKNEEGGYFYCVMELADDVNRGQAIDPENYRPRTLAWEAAEHRRLPFDMCLEVGLSIASALDFLHGRGLIHRDVKPSNIVFVNGFPKLGDIGLVAELSEARSYVGTEGFIPPEGPGTVQADLYSLGKVLYEISTGKDRHDYPDLPTLLDETPHSKELLELNKVILGACRTEARQRYRSAADMLADLQALRQGTPLSRKAVRGRRGVAVGLLGATVLIAAAIWGLAHWMGAKGPAPGAPLSAPSGLVGWWRGEGNASDSVQTNHGEAPNGIDFVPGMVGRGFVFYGTNQYIEISNAPSLNPTGALTLEAWVRPSGRTATGAMIIVAKDDASTNRQYQLALVEVDRQLFLRGHVGVPGSFAYADGLSPVPVNKWSHVAMTFHRSTLRIYMNGKMENAVRVRGSPVATTEPVRIGGLSSGPWYFRGEVDEVSLYDRALSDEEIRLIYQAGKTGKIVQRGRGDSAR